MPVDGEGVPEFIHLLPAGTITTQDGRGPYKVGSMAKLADELNAGGKLALDECHSTDLAAPKGAPAPARGWMTDFEARDDGLWAKVKWTGQGRTMMEDGAYNGISPVIVHDKAKNVVGLLRASLTNAPNLKGLTALHSEGLTMDWRTKLIELLGLDSEADDAAIEAALTELKNKPAAEAATHSQQSVTEHPAFIALQSEAAALAEKVNALTEGATREKADAFVDGAISEGRVGVKAARDEYVTMHMENPERAERLINALPKLTGGAGIDGDAPNKEAGKSDLTVEDRRVMQLMGISEDDYQAERAAEDKRKEAL